MDLTCDRTGRNAYLHSSQDLEAHKETIKRLFLEQNRPLDQVMEMMRLEHNVVASKKVYKSRLKKWTMTKNIRLSSDGIGLDEQALLKELHVARYWNRGQYRLANGHLVSTDRLIAYLARRRQPSYYKKQPFPSPTSTGIKSPDALHASEGVVLMIRHYIQGQYEDTVHTAEDLDRLRGIQSHRTAANNFYDFISQVELAVSQKNVTQALVEMRRAPAEVTKLLCDRPSVLISELCWFLVVVMGLVRSGRAEDEEERRQFFTAVRALVRYAAVYAANPHGGGLGLPAAHPLVAILRGLLAVEEDMMLPLALKGWKMSIATFDQLLDRPGSVSSFGDWLNLSRGSGSVDDLPPDLGEAMEDTCKRYEQEQGPSSENTIRAMWFHASYLSTMDNMRGLGRFRNEKSFQIHLEMLRRGVTAPYAKASANAHVACCYALRGERELAQVYIWAAMRIIAEQTGKRYHRYSSWLGDWLVEWGETEKLVELREWLAGSEPVVVVEAV